MTTQEGNKLIAEFMGWKIGRNLPGDIRFQTNWFDTDGLRKGAYLQFDNSWDWLMPVVEKIHHMGCIIEIDYSLVTSCRICVIGKKEQKAFNLVADNNGGHESIYAVWLSIIKFIEWYNTQKP